MDNKYRKLFIIKQSKGCKLYLKCTQIHLAAGLRADRLGELMRCPSPLAAIGGILLRAGRERRDLLIMTGKGPAYKGMEGPTFKRDGRDEGTEREGKGIPPPQSEGE